MILLIDRCVVCQYQCMYVSVLSLLSALSSTQNCLHINFNLQAYNTSRRTPPKLIVFARKCGYTGIYSLSNKEINQLISLLFEAIELNYQRIYYAQLIFKIVLFRTINTHCFRFVHTDAAR